MTQVVGQALSGQIDHMTFVHVDQDLILAAGRSQGVDLIEARSKQLIRIVAQGMPVTALAALPGRPHGDLLLVGGPNGQIWEINPGNGREIRALSAGPGEVRDFAVGAGPDGRELVAIARDAGVSLWHPDGTTFVDVPAEPGGLGARPFKVCLYRQAGRAHLACALTDGQIATWDLAGLDTPPVLINGHSGPIWTILTITRPDGTDLVASGGSDQYLRVWEPMAGGALAQVRTYLTGGTIRRLGHVVEAGVPMLVTASARGAVSLWRYDQPAERPVHEVVLHSGEVYAVACETEADAVTIASGDFNGDIFINRLTSNILVDHQMRRVARIPGTIWAVTSGRTALGDFYACAGVSRQIYVIDPATEEKRLILPGHESTVRALAFGGTPDDPHLISGGADHVVIDWNPATGHRRAELRVGHDAEVWALTTVEHQGRWYAVSGGPDGTVRRCPLDAPNEGAVIARDIGEVSSLDVIVTETEPHIVVGSTRGLYRVSLLDDELVAGEAIAPIATDAIMDVAALPSKPPRVVVAKADGNVELFDPVAGVLLKRFLLPVHENRQVRAVVVHETGGGDVVVFGGCDNGQILKWGEDGHLVGEPSIGGHTSIRDLRVTQWVAAPGVESGVLSGGHDGTLRYYPISKDRPLSSGGSLGAPVRAAAILLQDQPASADLLARSALTRTLCRALTSAETVAPVVVGVHAPWGQGKSSVLRQIREAIDPVGAQEPAESESLQTHRLFKRGTREPVFTKVTPVWAWKRLQERVNEQKLPYEMRPAKESEKQPITAWFNPWMYEERGQIWAGLTNEILTAITSRLPPEERKRLFIDLNLKRTDSASVRRQILQSYRPHSLRGVVGLVAGALILVAAVVAMMVAVVNTGQLDKILGSAAVIFFIALGVIIRLIMTSAKGFSVWYDPLAAQGPRMGGVTGDGAPVSDPLEAPDRGYLYLMRHDVREVIELASSSPLYIFIDDMDRCSPPIVADTIEAINLFLTKTFGDCVFVMGLDPATVAAHLEAHMPAIGERAQQEPLIYRHLRHTGWRFMEKIVDLPVRLPRVTDVAMRNYLDQLLLANRPGGAVTAVPAAKPAEQAAPAGGAERPIPAQRAGTAAPVTEPEDTPVQAPLPEHMEDIPVVRDALHEGVTNLPNRNPRQIKAFLNLWRFYMVLEYELGVTTNSLSATQTHSAEMARLVEIMVRWPWLLDALGTRRSIHGEQTILLDVLRRAAPDDAGWQRTATDEGLDPADEDVRDLRQLLTRRGTDGDELIAIAKRYL